MRESIGDNFGWKLLDPLDTLDADEVLWKVRTTLSQQYTPATKSARTAPLHSLPAHIPVSVVVATYDRPDGLANCLRCLLAQESSREVEIVVVDNNPASGLTPPVVAQFPGVVLVNEPRQGLAYARNAGFIASTGDIAATTDDDVTVPSNWLEKLIAPFARADVMAVTGHTLPIELETKSQRLFEQYGDGGLGRGFKRFEANLDWFAGFRRAIPTWILGATANPWPTDSVFST